MYRFVDLTKVFSLLHEDFPLVTLDGNVKFRTKDYCLSKEKGAIVHHWGWSFPDYVFLMCNDFEGPSTLLTLNFVYAITISGVSIQSGYLYLRYKDEEIKLVSPLQGNIFYFREGGKLSIIARFRKGKFVRVNIDLNGGVAFQHVFNTDCVIVTNAECEVEGVGKSKKAVLDSKDFKVIE